MSTIVTRSGKGSPLSHVEVDANFTNLNTDKIQSGNTVAALTITSATINGGAIDGTTVGATTASTGRFTSLSDSGNLTFTGTGNRILGDFSNATEASRVAIQTSTTNGNTLINALPNGTASVSNFRAYNNSDPTNAAFAAIGPAAAGSEVRIQSSITGTGTYIPLTMYTGGTEKFRIAADTTGTFTFSGTAPRITGDFSNGTFSNRVAFQTSTTNGNTSITVLPNGTAVLSQLHLYSNSDPTNSSRCSLVNTNSVISLTADITGTGTYLPIQIATGGSERLRIDTSGNVGIGATSIGGINGAVHFSTPITGATSSKSLFIDSQTKSSVTTSSSYVFTTASTEAATFTLTELNHFDATQGTFGAGSTVSNQYGFRVRPTLTGATNNYAFRGQLASATGRYNLYMDGTADNYIAGNVGIGTSSPAYKLEVSQNVNSDGAIQITNANAGTSAISEFRASNGTNVAWYGIGGTGYVGYAQIRANGAAIYCNTSAGIGLSADNAAGYITFGTGSGGTERMRIDSSGNVGIGTSSPDNALTIQDAGAGVNKRFSIRNGDSTNNHKLTMGYNAGALSGFIPATSIFITGETNGGYGILTALALGTVSATPIILGTSNTERMRIDSSGNLLVGATSTLNNNRLFVARSAFVAGFNVLDGTGEAVRFYSNGTAVGTIAVTGSATAYNTSSDYRLKENIAPMTGALARVSALKPVTYQWKVDGSAGEGFIAHELQAVVPDCVTGEKDALDAEGKPVYQGIDTSFLVATLTSAIQEQQTLIENLTTRLNALEGK